MVNTSSKENVLLNNQLIHPISMTIGQRIPSRKDALAVGFTTELEINAINKTSEIFLRSDSYIKAILYSNKYAADCLQPLELEIAPLDLLTVGGIEVSPSYRLSPTGSNLFELSLNLKRPPKFWVTVNGVKRRGTEKDADWEGGYEGKGKAELEEGEKLGTFRGLSATGDDSALRLGRWLTYRFEIRAIEINKFRTWIKASKMFPFSLESTEPRVKLPEMKKDPYLKLRAFPRTPSIDFKILYAIEGLLSFGKIIDYQVAELLTLMEPFLETIPKATRILQALFHLERITDLEGTINSVANRVSDLPFKALPNTALISKIVITPTRTLCYPPEQQTSNFVLRHFLEETNDARFIRMQFYDEGSQLTMNHESRKNDDSDKNEGIIARFRRCLDFGIRVGDRTFLPLAYSASQVRTHALWGIAFVNKKFTRGRIMDFLGNFETEKIIAKNASRRGLSFSTTCDAGEIPFVTKIEDFKTEDENYTFSDGVGICTAIIAHDSAIALRKSNIKPGQISAVQFRLGGAKGVLAVWPPPPRDSLGELLFPDLSWPEIQDSTKRQIFLRPSQIKFESPHAKLGVVLVSSFSRAYLNREALTLMYEGGIKVSDITKLQNQQISETMATEEEIVAGKLESHHKRLFHESGMPILELMQTGWNKEPFVRSIIRLLASKALYLIKWKARLFVEQSVQLLGIVDELGVLEEDEIYIRTIDNEGVDFTLNSKCIIYRAPTRHPGDIQVIEAVDHPALRASGLVNVIIFNRKGLRDLPSKLSGGDLDGDFFTVIWDSKFTRLRKEEPMDYTPPKSEYFEMVTAEQTRSFHNLYMKYNVLGAVSNAHLACADRYGANHPDTLELAVLCSHAVDAAKTGVFPELPLHLKPIVWPDFMPRRKETQYESERPLGRMFRNPLLNPIPELKPVEDVLMDPRIGLLPPPVTGAMNFARKLKSYYDLEMQGLMVRFTANEAEIFIGILLPDPTAEKLDNNFKLQDPLLQAFRALKSQIFEEIDVIVGEKNRENKKKAIALAAYLITFEQSKITPISSRMISFPFLFQEQLQALVSEIE